MARPWHGRLHAPYHRAHEHLIRLRPHPAAAALGVRGAPPDTLKAQHTAFLTAGHVCYSDMGRILCSIVDDTVGWHDTVCGVGDAALTARKYGAATFQTHRNAMYRNGRDGLLIELGKWGLGTRDLVANVNFFSKVTADPEGSLRFHPGHSRAGDYVDLRFDMNALVVLSTAPHPLEPGPRYQPAALRLTAWRAGVAPADDKCRYACPQNQRGFVNTERYRAGRCASVVAQR